MLCIIGLGIRDDLDITLRGLEAAKKAGKVFAEFYTCPIKADLARLEKNVGKKIVVLERKDVEESDAVIDAAGNGDAVLLVGGDPLSATTHAELVMRARKKGIAVKIIQAPSIFTAVAESGLHLYKFGRTVSIPKPQENYAPTSFYDSIAENRKAGLHTLCLLDIGMSAKQGLELLLSAEKERAGGKKGVKGFLGGLKLVLMSFGEETLTLYDTAESLLKKELPDGMFSIIIPGKLHFSEEEFLEMHRTGKIKKNK